jgi:hypothetical protein
MNAEEVARIVEIEDIEEPLDPSKIIKTPRESKPKEVKQKDDVETGLSEDLDKIHNNKTNHEFLQDIHGFSVYKSPRNLIVYDPNDKFMGYYTELSTIFNDVVRSTLIDKLCKRTPEQKKDIKSVAAVVSDHARLVKELSKQFEGLKVKL